MIDDVFCKIIKGELPADKVFENDDCLVIKDLHPQASLHLLVMPKKHFEKLEDFSADDKELLGKLLSVADEVAHQSGLDKGYRLIINEGEHGGKLVPHFHIHILGGKQLGPKMVKD